MAKGIKLNREQYKNVKRIPLYGRAFAFSLYAYAILGVKSSAI